MESGSCLFSAQIVGSFCYTKQEPACPSKRRLFMLMNNLLTTYGGVVCTSHSCIVQPAITAISISFHGCLPLSVHHRMVWLLSWLPYATAHPQSWRYCLEPDLMWISPPLQRYIHTHSGFHFCQLVLHMSCSWFLRKTRLWFLPVRKRIFQVYMLSSNLEQILTKKPRYATTHGSCYLLIKQKIEPVTNCAALSPT